MMIIIIAFTSLIILIISLYSIIKSIYKKRCDYLLNNSVALKKLLNINNKYNFWECRHFDEEYTYDNENFYNEISCQDYLIYQLQFNRFAVKDQIKTANENRKEYESYCKEVSQINEFGQFKKSSKALKNIERKLFKKMQKKPTINYTITITLNCSKINGDIYDGKQQVFDSEHILTLIRQLDDKNGYYYNNRSIWDSICRVERGKVSNKMRFSIYKRDGYRCKICGRSGYFTDLEIDHIKPISKGGKTTYSNLQTLCKRCNIEKGDKY